MKNKFLTSYLEKHAITLDDDSQKALDDFDPETAYAKSNGDEAKFISFTQHRILVGKVSNLINRMKNAGADTAEMVRALKHLLVLVGAPTHSLDWRKSAKDNGIEELMHKYTQKCPGYDYLPGRGSQKLKGEHSKWKLSET